MARRSWGLSEQWEERGALRGLDEGRLGWEDVVEAVCVVHRSKFLWKPLDEVQGRKRLVVGIRLALGVSSEAEETKRIRTRLAHPRRVPPSSWYHPPKRGRLREILGSVELPDVACAGSTSPRPHLRCW